MAEILGVPFTTWQDFKVGHVPQLFGRKLFQRGRYIFRGQGDAEWSLVSSFDRQFNFIEDRLARHSFGRILLSRFIELLTRHDVDIGLPKGAASNERVMLTFAQHYGLPTRLLDWTENAFVAAYFAFESHFINPSTKHVAIWAIDTKHPVWTSPRWAEIFFPPPLGNTRLRNQSGVFTLTYVERHYNTLEDYVRDSGEQGTALIKFTLPASEAMSAMVDLDSMDLNSGTLFEDPPGVARLAILRTLVNYFNKSDPQSDEV
jgi:hypothetical protein